MLGGWERSPTFDKVGLLVGRGRGAKSLEGRALKGRSCDWEGIGEIKSFAGVPIVAQWLTKLTRNHEVAGSTPGLAQ